MRTRSLERVWTAALALIAAIAIAMALYTQSVERKARQETGRSLGARPEAALEKPAETPGAEPAPDPSGDEPLPNTVLRRGESGTRLQQTLDSRDAQLALLRQDLEALERRSEQSDRRLHRDLEELRAAVRREQEASAKVQNLLLVALVPLLLHLLTSFWPRRDGDGPH